MTDRGAAFRALHGEDGAFIIPNPWDTGSARILHRLGFKALATTSSGAAFAHGVQDGHMSDDEVLDHCREIVAATPLPVSADLWKGFGDSPQSVHDTVLAAAETGLAGCSIEDHTGDSGNPIFEKSLAVERIAAAVEASRNLDRDFVLTARSENFLWGITDLEDTVSRLQAFEEAGADVLYAPGLRDLGAIRDVCAAVSRPVNVVMGLPGVTFSAGDLAQAGVKRISVGSALLRSAYGALISAATEMAEKGTFTFSKGAAGFGDIAKYFD